MHTVEPELLKPPPRRVRIPMDRDIWKAFGCVALLALPFVGAGLGVLIYLITRSLPLWIGNRAPGTVVSRRIVEGEENGNYRITYRYRVDDHWYNGEDDV